MRKPSRTRRSARAANPLTPEKAGHARYCVFHLDMTQTQAAIEVKLNSGTVNHVVHGRRFPDVPPIRPPWL